MADPSKPVYSLPSVDKKPYTGCNAAYGSIVLFAGSRTAGRRYDDIFTHECPKITEHHSKTETTFEAPAELQATAAPEELHVAWFPIT